jgi:hypothetical protein
LWETIKLLCDLEISDIKHWKINRRALDLWRMWHRSIVLSCTHAAEHQHQSIAAPSWHLQPPTSAMFRIPKPTRVWCVQCVQCVNKVSPAQSASVWNQYIPWKTQDECLDVSKAMVKPLEIWSSCRRVCGLCGKPWKNHIDLGQNQLSGSQVFHFNCSLSCFQNSWHDIVNGHYMWSRHRMALSLACTCHMVCKHPLNIIWYYPLVNVYIAIENGDL